MGNNGFAVKDLIGDIEVAGASKLGCTIMRTHLIVNVNWGALAAAPAFIQLGLRVADPNMIATPANFGPSAAPDDDWALNTRIPVHFTGAALDVVTVHQFDLRSRRHLSQMLDTWVMFIDNKSGAVASMQIFCRTLVMLP